MSVLMPDLASALRERATELARLEHARRQRRRQWWRRAGGAFTVVLLAGGTATALGLWDPPLGSNPGSPPGSTAAPPSQAATAASAALRRGQTEADRGAASRVALRFPATRNATIHVTSVRLLGTTAAGESIVLVPITEPAGEQLCLWVGRRQQRGARACTPTAEALRGALVLGITEGDVNSPEAVAARGEAIRKLNGKAGQLPRELAPPAGGMRVIGFAPDGASRATVEGVEALVEGNVFELRLPEESRELRADLS